MIPVKYAAQASGDFHDNQTDMLLLAVHFAAQRLFRLCGNARCRAWLMRKPFSSFCSLW